MSEKNSTVNEKILEIITQHRFDRISSEKAVSEILGLFADSSWKYVDEETPPNNAELLAKAPDGKIHLTTWRPAHGIFCCQHKSGSTYSWQWKLI